MSQEEAWIDAKKRYRLSDEHIRMAKELGLNPGKFGSYAPNKQEQWKEPLPDFIRTLYAKRFKKKESGR
ncbi:hypothetical protein [Methanospirillum hungatei]|uniref:hypothetical protein n=1 Tax=Methanospirillum hungatei TaxID=2203 RepID=UPI0026F31734|nr:hypothetical protein [Methanospirillum hungatei]MCA1916453.1 hypothetical protein [Methanospirillum hungatei]